MGRPDSRSLSNDRDEVYDATSELQLPATETDSTFASLPSFDEPPPPYDAFRPLPSVSSIPNTQPSGLAASPSHIIDFPSSPQLSLYHTKNRLNSSIFHLSISKDQPLYAVVFEGAWNYRQNIILFPDAEYEAGRAKAPAKEPLARVKGKGFWTTAADIQLLSSGPERAVHPAGSVATTSLRCRGLKTVVWGFVARTAGEGTEEGFEWRYSRGKEVKDLGKGSSGWKLVRLGREGVGLVQESEDDELESCYGSKIGEKVSNKEAKSNEIECHDDAFGRHSFSAAFSPHSASSSSPISASAKGKASSRRRIHREGVSSDGKEIVAVWAEHEGWSWHTNATLRFLGSGRTGELGADWAVLAVSSMLWLYKDETGEE